MTADDIAVNALALFAAILGSWTGVVIVLAFVRRLFRAASS